MEDPAKSRIVIEKPFGRDYSSARKLNKIVQSCADESQIYRIDHYLGKETVQTFLYLDLQIQYLNQFGIEIIFQIFK